MQLEPYIELFGREKIYPMTFEALIADPAAELRRLWRWLEIDDTLVLPDIESKKHARAEVVQKNRPLFNLKKLRRLNNRTFRSQRLKDVIKRLNKRWRVARIDVKRANEDVELAKSYLRPIMMRQTKELESLLARDFPEWAALHGALED